MKKCFKCHLEQPVSQFYRHSAMSDGLLGKCKTCAKRDSATNRQNKLEQCRAYDRKRGRTAKRKRLSRRLAKALRRRNPEAYRERQRARRAREPEKYRARNAISNAIRDGKLTRQPCEKCGGKAQAHHKDYSRPLEVQWLCEKHHKQAHRRYAQ